MAEGSTTKPADAATSNNVVTPPSANDPAILTIDGTKNNTPSTTASTSKTNEKRIKSEGVNGGGGSGYPYQQQQPSPFPPSQIVYKTTNNNINAASSSNASHSSNSSEDPSGAVGGPLPPIPGYPPTHSRDRSWSGGAFGVPPPPPMMAGAVGYPYPPTGGMPPGMPPSMMHMYLGGVPPPPPQQQQPNVAAMMMAANQDTIGSTGSSSSRRSKRKDYPGHRRVHSYNGYSTQQQSYGAMDPAAFFAPPPGALPPTAPRTPRSTAAPVVGRAAANGGGGGGKHHRSNSGDFSPVSEIRNLAGRSPRPSPVPSPRMTQSLRGLHARTLSGDGSFFGAGGAPIPPPLMMPPVHSMDPYHPQSPRVTLPNRGVFLGSASSDDDNGSFNGSTSPMNSSLRGHKFRGASDGSDVGGEAVFLLDGGGEKKSRRHHHHKSSRKMHMRQKSAQLFMEDVKGIEQIPSCRDLIFLLLFVFHLIGIVCLGNTYGYESQRLHDETLEDSDSSITIMYTNLIYMAGLCGIIAAAIAALALLLMTSIAKKIVQVALGLAITFIFVWGTMGIGLSPKKIVPVAGIIALALIIAYAFIVWDRLPFTAANLDAGLQGIRANPGAVVVAFFFQLLALGWSIYYSFVVVGVYDAIQMEDLGTQFQGADKVIYALLGISYYWTLNVFLNVVQVTVAGVIGRWWYKEDGDTDSNGADLIHAIFRSCFYSLGSICFGSLVVGPVQILRQLSVFFRPNDELNSLLCLHECIHFIQTALSSFVDSLSDRFNSWSFTYIGLYGYGLVDAGLHSTELFEKRGWTTIVSDDLVPNVLGMISLGIGGITGMMAYLLEDFECLSLTSFGVPLMTSFVIGALVGLVVSSVLFGIISSSVNAVIVLFAASPVDFEQNHPQLSDEMRRAWRELWPGCMDVIDMRVQVAGYLDPTLNGVMPMHTSERHPLLH